MRSQAQTVAVADYSARLSAVLDKNEVFLIDGDRQRLLQYRTPLDAQIVALEGAAATHFGIARRFFNDVKLKRARGADWSDAMRFCRSSHDRARAFLRDIARLVAQRDASPSLAAE